METTTNNNAAYEYAGFWIRAAATMIDAILLIFITFPLLIVIYGWEYFDNTDVIVGPADIIISWIFPCVATLSFWIKKQATPGKMLFSLKIVDSATGQPAQPTQLIGRYLAYFISAFVLCLGYIWVGFDKRKQGWHDKLAGTVVIRKLPAPASFVSFNGVE